LKYKKSCMNEQKVEGKGANAARMIIYLHWILPSDVHL
jgi:hypothetical protein